MINADQARLTLDMYHFHVADDHPLFRNALLEVLKQNYPDSVVVESVERPEDDENDGIDCHPVHPNRQDEDLANVTREHPSSGQFSYRSLQHMVDG